MLLGHLGWQNSTLTALACQPHAMRPKHHHYIEEVFLRVTGWLGEPVTRDLQRSTDDGSAVRAADVFAGFKHLLQLQINVSRNSARYLDRTLALAWSRPRVSGLRGH